jgi:hypothetical protein
MFEAFVFLAFLAHVCCSGMCMYTLVYCPIADCLALENLQYLEARSRRFNDMILWPLLLTRVIWKIMLWKMLGLVPTGIMINQQNMDRNSKIGKNLLLQLKHL